MDKGKFYNVPKGWFKTEFRDILETVSPPKKFKSAEYLDIGRFPIIDQGKKKIIAYTNEENSLVRELPALIFGDHTKEVKLIDFPFAVGGDGVKILKSRRVISSYLKFSLESAANKLPNLGYSRHFRELKNIVDIFPDKNEQVHISTVLSLWDKYIDNLSHEIIELESRDKWFTNQLLTGKKRFPQFVKTKNRIKTKLGELPEDWDIKYISNVVKRIRNSFTPNPNEIYHEIGIRSHTKGIFYKEPVTGKSLGNKSVFWIEPECFVVNIVFAWEHAIAKTTEKEIGMIASHRFPMYKPKDGVLDLDYLLYFFKSKRGKHLLGLASPGGAGRNKTLGQSEFIKLQIPVPGIEEQKAIANAISAANRELFLLEKKLNKLKEQKKGLMQQLLTGKTRIINHHKFE